MRDSGSSALVVPVTADGESFGWVAKTFAGSLQTAVLVGNAIWQLAMIVVVFSSPETIRHAPLIVAAHLGVAALALLARWQRVPLWVVVVAVDVVLLLDWAVADSIEGAFCLAATWMFHLAQFQVAMLLDGRQYRILGPLGGIGVPIGIAILHPEGALSLIPAAVGGLGIRRAARLGVPWLASFAGDLDRQTEASWRERQRAAAARSAAREAAEQTRTLHDTAVNTLAAVASGGGSIRDLELVRRRCDRDAEVLGALVAGTQVPTRTSLHTVAEESGLVVRAIGLDAEVVDGVVAGLPDAVARALEGGVREAAQNAAKHAAVDHIDLRVELEDDHLSVTVTDDGVGFDAAPGTGSERHGPEHGPEHDPEHGRGLLHSVQRRAEDAGVGVAIESRPGVGTAVHFRCSLGGGIAAGPAIGDGRDVLAVIDDIRSRAAWATVAGVVAVGVVIEAFGRPGVLSLNYAMLAFVALTGLGAWRDVRRRRHLSGIAASLMVGAVAVTYVLAFAAVDFDLEGLVHWHSLGVAAPVVILLVHGRGRGPFMAGLGALLGTASVATIMAASDGRSDVATIIPVATAPALVVVGGWYVFHRTLLHVGRRVSADQQASAAASVEHVAREAAAAARARWRDVGLRSCLDLLRRLAEGALVPTDPRVRDRCSVEEAYLRQLMLLDPELPRIGHWFGQALATARGRGVDLVVRSGGTDVANDDDADALGRLLVGVVASVPVGAEVTAALFPLGDRLRFSLVTPRVDLDRLARRWPSPAGWTSSVTAHGDTEVVELLG